MRQYNVEQNEFETIIWYDEDGKRFSFTTDPANSDYAEYLRYTEWVEAGNTPEDFWTQDEELEILDKTQVTEEETPQETEGES